MLGAAHIGTLRAIEEAGIEIACISGTSIGGFVAAMYAFGISPDKMEEIVSGLDWFDAAGLSLSKYGLLDNERFGNVISRQIGDRDISEARIPLAIIAANIANGEKVTIRSGPVAEAVRATSAIPGIFRPVERDGEMLIDGGAIENVPISPLRDMGADVVIACDLISTQAFSRPEGIIEILLNSFHMALVQMARQTMSGADIRIAPELSEFDLIDADQTPGLIKAGYRAASKSLSDYF